MRHNVFITVLQLSLLVFAYRPALAEGWVFMPRVGVGYGDYELDVPGVPGISEDQSFRAKESVYSIGGTLYKGSYYLDAYAQKIGEAEDDFEAPFVSYTERFAGDRNEYSLALGVSVLDNLSIYVGYKGGKTDTSGAKGSKSEFREDGYFIGTTLSTPVGEKSLISLNLSVADLDGDIKFTVPGLLVDFDAVAESQGLSYGISWKSQLAKNWAYTVSLDGYQYEFDDIVDTSFGAINNTLDEGYIALKLSIAYEFEL